MDLYTPEQMHVLDVRPGITDAASIKFRNESEFLKQVDDPEKHYVEVLMPMKLDLYLQYVNYHSFKGDIRLILETLWTVIAQK